MAVLQPLDEYDVCEEEVSCLLLWDKDTLYIIKSMNLIVVEI